MSPMAALLVVVWPGLAALVVLLFGLALRRWRFAGEAAGACAVAVGFIVAEVVVRGIPPRLPAEATRWLPHIAVVLAIAGVLRAIGGKALWVIVFTGVALGGSTILLLGPGMHWGGGGANATAMLLLAAAGLAAVYIAGRCAGNAPPPWLSPLLLAAVCFGAGIALAQSYMAAVGQLLTGLGGILAAVALMGAWWRRMGSAAGAMPVAAGILALALMLGRIYSELPTTSAILLLLAAAAPVGMQAPGVRRLPLTARAGLALAAVAALAGAAIILTPMGLDFST